MKRHKTGEWIQISERTPNKAEIKKYIILYYYDPVIRERGCSLKEFVSDEVVYGSRTKTHWMKIERPNKET
jgi:hypothetical protein